MFCYIHIPFCSSKCKYCRFASFSKIDKLKIKSYIQKLKEDIASFSLKQEKLESIYFGWWTPSILEIPEIKEIIESLKNKFWFEENIEINLETTPQNISEENLIWWKNLWINRISVWIQTLNDESLKEIWRENKEIIIKALDKIKKPLLASPYQGRNNYEFFSPPDKGELEVVFNISLDFIIWLPHTKLWETKKDIEFILDNYHFVKHISIYMLEDHYYNFENSLKDSEYLEEYKEVRDFLEENWFMFYELSNSAKPWYECKHNKAYWNHSEMRAFWLWSHFFIDKIRYENDSSFAGFYEWKQIQEKLEEKDIFLEKIMFDLRTSWIDKNEIWKLNFKKINEFIKDWFLEEKSWKICLTNKSYTIVDFILKEII